MFSCKFPAGKRTFAKNLARKHFTKTGLTLLLVPFCSLSSVRPSDGHCYGHLRFLILFDFSQRHTKTSNHLNGCIETTVFNSLVYVVISSFLVLALSLPVQAFFLEDLGIEDLNATLSVQNARKYATSGKVGQPSQFDSVHVDDVKNQPGPCTLGSLGTVGHIDGGEYRDDQCLNVCWCPTMCPIYMCKAVAMLRFACRSRRASIFLQVVFS